MTDFNKITDRRGTDSLKYDFAVERGKPADVLPLWVADMDFSGPECIKEALQKAIEPGIFGYTEAKDDYYDIVRRWFSEHFSWETESQWIIKTPGVVFALAMAVRAYTKPGDNVLIASPVYYPFYGVIEDNDRKVAASMLKLSDGHYELDYEDIEKQIIEKKIKLMIFCSPHNPVGRVWRVDELKKLGSILKKHDVVLVSDEIHADIVYKPYVHHIFTEAVPEMAEKTIICTAPSKTFNIAGLQVSNIFIQNEELRKKYQHEIDASGYSQLNMLGIIACKAAYKGGEEWLREALDYLKGNLDYIRTFVEEEMPGVKLIEPEGTYFAWLDFRGTGLKGEKLENLVLNKAKLWLDGGYIFGEAGDGFQRIAYACPRATLEEGMRRLKKVLE